VAKGEVKNLLTKQNMKRGPKYLFGYNTFFDDFYPFCTHVKSSRLTEVGKTWDNHLKTIYQVRRAANATAGDQSKKAKAAAVKKAEEEEMEEIDKRMEMMTD
jgi:hypothetical protein